LLASCASKNEFSVDFKSNIRAATNVNPDFKGQPSPVVVRLYQLAGKAAFDTLTYAEFFENDHSKLGNEYITLDEFLIEPDSTTPVELKISENTRFIGVIAGFRDLDQATWRHTLAIPEKRFWRDNGIEVQVSELAVKVVKLK
jgi:type VI secretion system protein VasD